MSSSPLLRNPFLEWGRASRNFVPLHGLQKRKKERKNQLFTHRSFDLPNEGRILGPPLSLSNYQFLASPVHTKRAYPQPSSSSSLVSGRWSSLLLRHGSSVYTPRCVPCGERRSCDTFVTLYAPRSPRESARRDFRD